MANNFAEHRRYGRCPSVECSPTRRRRLRKACLRADAWCSLHRSTPQRAWTDLPRAPRRDPELASTRSAVTSTRSIAERKDLLYKFAPVDTIKESAPDQRAEHRRPTSR